MTHALLLLLLMPAPSPVIDAAAFERLSPCLDGHCTQAEYSDVERLWRGCLDDKALARLRDDDRARVDASLKALELQRALLEVIDVRSVPPQRGAPLAASPLTAGFHETADGIVFTAVGNEPVPAPLIALDKSGRAHEVIRARAFDLVAVCNAKQVPSPHERRAVQLVWRVRGARAHGEAVAMDSTDREVLPFAQPKLKRTR